MVNQARPRGGPGPKPERLLDLVLCHGGWILPRDSFGIAHKDHGKNPVSPLDKSGLIGLGVMEQGDHFLQRNPGVDNREDTDWWRCGD